MLVRLIFNCTVLIWLSFYEIAPRKKNQPETTMIQNIFPVPSLSVYIFFSFFSPRNNQTQEILYSIFFSKRWWPTCCFCGCDSFNEWEKRMEYRNFKSSSDGHSCSGLGFPLSSYNKSQNNTNIIQLLKQRLKDRKWSLDFKTFL